MCIFYSYSLIYLGIGFLGKVQKVQKQDFTWNIITRILLLDNIHFIQMVKSLLSAWYLQVLDGLFLINYSHLPLYYLDSKSTADIFTRDFWRCYTVVAELFIEILISHLLLEDIFLGIKSSNKRFFWHFLFLL